MSEVEGQALALLKKAGDDLHAAQCLSRDPSISVWTIGFHAQQAIEKALKSVLMQHDIRYPFTHDIEALVDLLKKGALRLPPESGDLSYLTPFGTQFRYEDEQWGLINPVTIGRMLGYAETTVAWARSMLQGGKTDL